MSTLEETSSPAQENFQEKFAQELHESFEDYNTDEASNINPSSPLLLPPRPLKPHISIRMGLYTKVKSNTWDRYAPETTLSKDEPNSSRSSKSINLTRWTSFFGTGSATSSSTSDHDREILALHERIAAGEILVEKQKQEIATLRKEVAETRIMLQELKAQMEQFVE